MKRAFLTLIAVVSTACSTTTVPADVANTANADVPVREVVQVVKRALLDTSQSMKGLPPLKSVTLTLTTSVEKEVGGDFELVVKAGGSRASSSSQEITIELTPPKGQLEVASSDIYKALKDALLAAARAARDARTAGGKELALNSFSVEIGFEVTKKVNGGIEFSLGPVKIGPTASKTDVAGNKISVSFEEKEEK